MRSIFCVMSLLALCVATGACESLATVGPPKTVVQPVDGKGAGAAAAQGSSSGGVNEPAGNKCVAVCGSRECGSDGCGSTCGSNAGGCSGNATCDVTLGKCQAQQTSGSGASQQGSSSSGGAGANQTSAYCPANTVYCTFGSSANVIQCLVFTGTATSGKCDSQTGAFTAMVSGASAKFAGGIGLVVCGSSAATSQWKVCPQGLHNSVGKYMPQEDFTCASSSYQCGGGSGGAVAKLASGDVTCVMRRADSTSWITLWGGGSTSGAINPASTWKDLGSPYNSQVSFPVHAEDVAYIGLPQISATPLKYARGYDGAAGNNVTFGTWGLKCPNVPEIVWNSSTPVCVGHAVGALFQPCVEDEGADFHRFAVRLR